MQYIHYKLNYFAHCSLKRILKCRNDRCYCRSGHKASSKHSLQWLVIQFLWLSYSLFKYRLSVGLFLFVASIAYLGPSQKLIFCFGFRVLWLLADRHFEDVLIQVLLEFVRRGKCYQLTTFPPRYQRKQWSALSSNWNRFLQLNFK